MSKLRENLNEGEIFKVDRKNVGAKFRQNYNIKIIRSKKQLPEEL